MLFFLFESILLNMKNIINNFYNLEIEKTILKNNKYFIISKKEKYLFKECNKNIDMNILIETQKYEKFYRIIANKNNELITRINDKEYILLKLSNKEERSIKKDIEDLMKNEFIVPMKMKNYKKIWEHKIDKFEEYIKNKKEELKYREYYDYYIGLGENAIKYYMYIKNNNIRYTFTYRRIYEEEDVIDLYDPTNVIIDPFVRTISEYIKDSIVNNKKIDFDILNKMELSFDESILLICRVLFPTYFFDIHKKRDFEKLKKIINNSSKIEETINYLINYYKNIGYEIPKIDWLN